jgi:putative protease
MGNELLLPAGDMNKLKTALMYGADAVYMGIPPFSMRSRENEFDEKSFK